MAAKKKRRTVDVSNRLQGRGKATTKRSLEAMARTAKAQTRVVKKRAHADVLLVRERMERIRRDFYEVGQALSRLKKPVAYRALGYASFEALVREELDMSLGTANRLVLIAENMSAELANEVGQSHAWALVRLTQATPEADTAREVQRKTIRLPSGDRLHVPSATVREKLATAAVLRETRGTKQRRGKTTTAEERQMAKEIEASLRAVGVSRATVRAVATKAGQAANVRIEGVPLSRLSALCEVICPG